MMAATFMSRKRKLNENNNEHILLIGDGKCLGVFATKTNLVCNSVTLPPKQGFFSSIKSDEPVEQILIDDEYKSAIHLKNVNTLSSSLSSSAAFKLQNLLPSYLEPKLNRYLLAVCHSAILYREQIVKHFKQRPPSKIVPKRIQLIGNNGTFIGASISQNIIKNAEINIESWGLFLLSVTIDWAKKQLLILMWQKDQNENSKIKSGSDEEEDDCNTNKKYLCKYLSKTVYNLAKLYFVLNAQNANKPRPWALNTAKQNVYSNNLSNNPSNSKIIGGKLLDKVCYFSDQFTISINFKEYRLGNARSPSKPKVSITMESRNDFF